MCDIVWLLYEYQTSLICQFAFVLGENMTTYSHALYHRRLLKMLSFCSDEVFQNKTSRL